MFQYKILFDFLYNLYTPIYILGFYNGSLHNCIIHHTYLYCCNTTKVKYFRYWMCISMLDCFGQLVLLLCYSVLQISLHLFQLICSTTQLYA